MANSGESNRRAFVKSKDINVMQAMIDRGEITNLNVVRTGLYRYYFGHYGMALIVQARDGWRHRSHGVAFAP